LHRSFKKNISAQLTKISGEEKNKNYSRDGIKARISFENSGQNPVVFPSLKLVHKRKD
jgi:hypothetical protein